ncbi:hypothetical protein [Rhodoferax sp.]|uniref:hypothetical protein n=1 Tax=Rhodoferax sp. TaxID=50421 RepID=UPI00276A5F53|nr:hypothetical protein [Rhodoferax sp.]
MKRQRGAALMVILLIAGVLAAFFALRALNSGATERDKTTAAALAQAKDALIGYAVTYRDTRADEVFGYLPCPDTNNDGFAEPVCGARDVSVMGRLPWRTLGLPPLRDSAGECLWYAVSGRAKNNPDTDVLNWDMLGQFGIVEAITGATLAAPDDHGTPWAVVFAPRVVLGAQVRAGGVGTECAGPSTAAAAAMYLDGPDPLYAGTAPAANANSTLALSIAESVRNGINNDQAISITSTEIFDRVKRRSDFKADIDALVGDLADYLNGLPPAMLPATSVGNKGADTVLADFTALHSLAWPALKTAVQTNWRSNLLYARPAGLSTVNSTAGCSAVLLFAGERTLRTAVPLTAQVRATPAQTGNPLVFGDPAMYLEGPNTVFPGSGAYAGVSFFDPTAASADVVRCITGLPAGATQASFAMDFGTFIPVGVGVTTDPINKTVTIADAAGAGGGCLWSPTVIPLAGKTLRAYYDYKFGFDDPFALTGVGLDRGNGFAMQMVTGQFGVQPNTCGTEATMGVLGSADVWGHDSIIFETDVFRDAARADPVENHSAIMMDGFLDHAPLAPSSTISAACDGSAAGCAHSAANQFEELSLQTHNQRIEIYTGCNASCSVCSPAAHGAPTNYAQINAWVDCKDCSDISQGYTGLFELIASRVNRSFEAPGNWSGTNWVLGAGVLSHSAGANPVALPASALLVPAASGAEYDVSFTTATTTPGTLAVTFGGVTASAISLVPGVPVGSPVRQSLRIKAVSAGALVLTPNAAWVGSIDNVSVQPVESLDPEIIAAAANRTFEAAGSWTGTNWAVVAGALSHTVGANTASLPNAALVGPAAVGATYQVTFTTATSTSGTLGVSFGGAVASPITLVPGLPAGTPVTHSLRLTATSSGVLSLTPNATWVGTVDNISIKAVVSPHMSRCVALDPVMNSVFFGFTGGFRSGAPVGAPPQQGVTLKNLYLRSQ